MDILHPARSPAPVRPRAAARLAAAVLLAACAPSLATTWICGLSDEGTRLVCAADLDAATAGGTAPPSAAVVNGTAFPLDPARVYTVPLWTPPTEAEFVEQLARATICYRSPGCQVVLAPSPWLGRTAAAARRR